ncbi:hypothetical protein Q7C36_017406 [Tachysurus vachellii]|uniref:Uncharacterized protein n=1 Tax=Tachysurus vachellii TaxID=175792 RepID=A0AA88M312_TACVA|nr:hypothetical protein Q7C36_017406 [Tachysurus vachellii]
MRTLSRCKINNDPGKLCRDSGGGWKSSSGDNLFIPDCKALICTGASGSVLQEDPSPTKPHGKGGKFPMVDFWKTSSTNSLELNLTGNCMHLQL